VVTLAVLTIVGWRAGTWLHNAGGVALALTCGVLLVLPLVRGALGSLPDYSLVPHELPDRSLMNVSILGKMGFGAFCGFEYVAIVAGECREPRAIGRSVVIASAGAVVVYVFGTATVLAFVPRGDIDLVSPIAQAFHAGLAPFAGAAQIVPVVVAVLLGCSLAGASVNFVSTTRLPMVAGWDRMLPSWFGRLHPRTGTPVNAIVISAAMALGVAVASMLGVRHQEAYQVVLSAALVVYALAYVALFAIPLLRPNVAGQRPRWWLRCAAACGLAMTLLYIVTAIIPIVEVQSAEGFSTRIAVVVAGGNALGIALLVLARRRTRR
jgi:amino acid transporter